MRYYHGGGVTEWEVHVTSRSAHKDFGNINYVRGNAHDKEFIISELSRNHYDVIVDFMNYGYQEFVECHRLFLDNTDHYIFLSSSRVYDASSCPLIESSPRLLDATEDEAFLATQRYALRKARQEDVMCHSGKNNYSIIRPYITYSPTRLQLGIYEKEQWLYRVLNDKSLIIRKEILNKKTTLTCGADVSTGIYQIMKGKPIGEAVHIVAEETMSWKEILDLYADVIFQETGKQMSVYITDSMAEIESLFEGGYNTKYDRLFDRSFDNTKAQKICGHINYVDMKTGLTDCLHKFIAMWKIHGNAIFREIMWDYEAMMDRMLGISSCTDMMGVKESELYHTTLKDSSLASLENRGLVKYM